jgi:hypothetical protein
MMDLHDMHSISVFAIGAALASIAGICITTKAYREAFVIPSCGGRNYVLAAMAFIMSVDLLIAVMGCWIALPHMQSRIGGGTRG